MHFELNKNEERIVNLTPKEKIVEMKLQELKDYLIVLKKREKRAEKYNFLKDLENSQRKLKKAKILKN